MYAKNPLKLDRKRVDCCSILKNPKVRVCVHEGADENKERNGRDMVLKRDDLELKSKRIQRDKRKTVILTKSGTDVDERE